MLSACFLKVMCPKDYRSNMHVYKGAVHGLSPYVNSVFLINRPRNLKRDYF
jgi:hypothetical protein